MILCAWGSFGARGQKRGPGRCIMRKYHLSELNLFWGLSPLSPQCSGRLCDNASAETQTGNNSSPIGGPSDLRLPLSLMQTHTLTHSLPLTHTHTHKFTLSLFSFHRIGWNKRECQKRQTHTHFTDTSECATCNCQGVGLRCTACLQTLDPWKNSLLACPLH